MKLRIYLAPVLLLLAVMGLVVSVCKNPGFSQQNNKHERVSSDLQQTVKQLDILLERSWANSKVSPAGLADELTVLRRLSLALHGTIPSLEEVREFESDSDSNRLDHWTRRMLQDPRFGNYFAERLSRAFVGTDEGPFLVFRRDRFNDWLSRQILADRPYDEVVRQLIAQNGLWTGKPATNFVTAALVDDDIDENKLVGRTVRAFLGQRIDCAQCHDHPFRDWKQSQFESLAAYYGQASLSPFGIEDRPTEYQIQDPETEEERVVIPSVPFQPELLPKEGSRREKLAHWVTHEDNRRFHRAIANRVWGLIFGRPWEAPVDDLDDPPESGHSDFLDVLAEDFRKHDHSLKRLIEVITATKAFRVDSSLPDDYEQIYETAESRWAVFPMIRLRPEQVIGSVLQTASIRTIDRDSHFLARLIRFVREEEFIQEYGDFGADELDERGGTIPQRLLLMNGSLISELTESQPFNSTGRIAALASTEKKCVEVVFLTCLSRYPTTAELEEFSEQLKGSSKTNRDEVVSDLFWSLVNSTEYSWNH